MFSSRIPSELEDSMTLFSAGLDYTSRNEGSNWTHKGGSPSSPGRTAGDICWGLWDLYWKPLRELDISDHREQDKQLKNDENWEENETLEGRIVPKILVHVLVQRVGGVGARVRPLLVRVACQSGGWPLSLIKHAASEIGREHCAVR